MAKLQRMDKIFSGLGLLSRSDCKTAVKRGEIRVNGGLVLSPEEKADPDRDAITWNGVLLDTATYVYYMLNKPAGVITATEDKKAKTVFDLLEDKRTDLAAVGRLDKDTTGILMITNNGELNHRLLAPRYHVPKTYIAVIDGTITKEDKALLERGLDIGDEKPTLPAVVKALNEENPQTVSLTITEGRFHQVKRMFEAVGKPVITLHRASFGPLILDPDLPEGEYRPLTEEERASVFSAAGLKEER